MNLAHLHILLNHIPVLWTLLGLLALAAAAARRSGDAKKAALGILVLSSILTVPTYLTGDGAAEIVDHLPGVSAKLIEAHDEWAGWALTANLVLGVLAAVCLVLYGRSRDIPRAWTTVVLVLALVTCGILGWTANLGGRIHHEEARPEFQPAAGGEPATGGERD